MCRISIRHFRCIVGERPFSLSEAAKHVGPGGRLVTIPPPVGSTARCPCSWVRSVKSGVLRAASGENRRPNEYRAFRRKQTFRWLVALISCSRRYVGYSVGGMAGTRYEMAGYWVASRQTEHRRLRAAAEPVFECSLARGCMPWLEEHKPAGSRHTMPHAVSRSNPEQTPFLDRI